MFVNHMIYEIFNMYILRAMIKQVIKYFFRIENLCVLKYHEYRKINIQNHP